MLKKTIAASFMFSMTGKNDIAMTLGCAREKSRSKTGDISVGEVRKAVRGVFELTITK